MNPDSSPVDPGPAPLAALRRFARPANKQAERCELCSAELGADHEHLVDPGNRQLLCACGACALLFSSSTAAKFRRVPRRVRSLPDFRLTDAQWESLMIPIGLAFFFRNSVAGKLVAIYPPVQPSHCSILRRGMISSRTTRS